MFVIVKHVTGVLDISQNGFPCADVSSTVFHTVVSHYERSKVNGGQRRVETTSDVLEERKQKSKFTVHGMCVCRYVCTKRRKIKKGRRGGEKEKEKFKESNSRRRKKERKEWKFMYISKKIYKKNLENGTETRTEENRGRRGRIPHLEEGINARTCWIAEGIPMVLEAETEVEERELEWGWWNVAWHVGWCLDTWAQVVDFLAWNSCLLTPNQLQPLRFFPYVSSSPSSRVLAYTHTHVFTHSNACLLRILINQTHLDSCRFFQIDDDQLSLPVFFLRFHVFGLIGDYWYTVTVIS